MTFTPFELEEWQSRWEKPAFLGAALGRAETVLRRLAAEAGPPAIRT